MSNIQAETGIQLLTRIKNSKKNLINIDRTLFPDGLNNEDIVEITSENNYLKNAILIHLISKTILVNRVDDFEIGGLNAGVLLIDTSFQFQFSLLMNYLENFLNDFDNVSIRTNKEEVLEKSLKNLTYMPIYDSQQLLASFHFLNSTLSMNPLIKLIIFDDIGANYWQDTINGGIRRMNLYEKKVISTLQNSLHDFKIPIIYVRSYFLFLKHSLGCKLATYKLGVFEKEKCNSFVIEVSNKMKTVKKLFTISSHKLLWL